MTFPLDTADETNSGVYDKQTTASAEKGKIVFDAVINELLRHINLLKKTRTEDLMEKPRV
jgi:creatinine amidohydrolase/Fe(II)-dependent formamide hydrolase-like protein